MIHAELQSRFAQAVCELTSQVEATGFNAADEATDADVRHWLDGTGPSLDWAGAGITPDEWFFITTLYGRRTLNQQRRLIWQYFPRFVREAGRDVRKLTPDVTRDWVLDQNWMRDRLLKMGGILRERGMTMQGYVEHLRMIDEKNTPIDPMPALDTIIRDHGATSWKTLSVFVRDCVWGKCFPIDSRVETQLVKYGLPINERLLLGLCLDQKLNPRRIARIFYQAQPSASSSGPCSPSSAAVSAEMDPASESPRQNRSIRLSEERMQDTYEIFLGLLRDLGGDTRQEQLKGGEYAVWNMQHHAPRQPGGKGKLGTFKRLIDGRCNCALHVGRDRVQAAKGRLEGAGLHPNEGGGYYVCATLCAHELNQHEPLIREILKMALNHSASN